MMFVMAPFAAGLQLYWMHVEHPDHRCSSGGCTSATISKDSDAQTPPGDRVTDVKPARRADLRRARAQAVRRADRVPEIGAGAAVPARPDGARDRLCRAARTSARSSLLNALTNRKALARTSNTPGRTQELNFFDVGEPLQFRLVDMPGYGFAKAPKDMVKRWRFLINDYLRGRQVLKRALVLVDARHGIKEVDREVMDDARRGGGQLSSGPDQGRQGQGDRARRGARRRRPRPPSIPAAHPTIFTTSSETGSGIAELRTAILEATD